MNCKNVIRLALLGLAVVLWSGSASAAERPNVVVLLSDDLGWKDIGCYGGPVKTPELDQLAEGGIRFTDFYSGCAVCSPSRATLLTGRQHIRAGLYSWIHDPTQRTHLLEREVTLAEILKEAGYATAHVGKWHLGLSTDQYKKPDPAAHGFDYWFATPNNADPSHHNPDNFIRNGKAVGKMEGYACQLVADEAITWLDEHRPADQPFFLNVWFHEPHAPIAAPDEIVSEYGKLNDRAAIYSGTIDNEDRAIGRLLAKLREVAPPEETIIIYASDNGSYRRDRVGELRGSKGTNWEGGIRVPGIVSWPGKIEAGKVNSTPVGLVDLLPTVCGLLDLETPSGVHLDGADLSPILRPQAGKKFAREQPLFWHLHKGRPIVAMRDGKYSMVADPDYELSTDNRLQESWIPSIRKGGYANFRLYNLEKDPSQTHDLAEELPEVAARMRAELLKINASVMADGAQWHLED
ncbi:MAG: sulfatase-like hydrolase/transferase [Pirellulaceae bacterium]